MFEATHRRVARMIEEGWRVSGSTTLTVWSIPAVTSSDWPTSPPRPGSPSRRSWNRVSGCPTGRSPAPPATTPCGRSTVCSSTPPAKRRPRALPRLTGDQLTSAEHVERGKRMIVDDLLVAEVERIAALAPEVADAGRGRLRGGGRFRGVSVLPARRGGDLDKALVLAEQRRPELASAFEALSPRSTTPRTSWPGGSSSSAAPPWPRHRGHRLLPVRPLHRPQRGRRRRWRVRHRAGRLPRPAAGSPPAPAPVDDLLSTHDTKRGEDVRARLAVLAELGRSGSGSPRLPVPAPGSGTGPSPTSSRRPWSGRSGRGAGTAARVRGEGDAGGQRGLGWTSLTRVRVDLRRHGPGLRRRRRPGRPGAAGSRWSSSRAGPTLSARSWSSCHSGDPDVYQHRAVGGLAGRPRRPAAVDFTLLRSLLASVTGGALGEDAAGRRSSW